MLVDTNVLVDVLENDPDWADWSIAQLRAQAQIHRLVINPVIYAELSLTFSTVEALDEAPAALQIPVIDIPKPALFLAGKAFVKYRRPGGTKSNVLADLFYRRSRRSGRLAGADARCAAVCGVFPHRSTDRANRLTCHVPLSICRWTAKNSNCWKTTSGKPLTNCAPTPSSPPPNTPCWRWA